MIYIAQGHEQGIGIEVFIKSFLCLPTHQQQKIIFVGFPHSLRQTLDSLQLTSSFYPPIPQENLTYLIHKVLFAGCELQCLFLDDQNTKKLPQSTVALNRSLEILASDPQHILVTLPTSKDQLILNEKKCHGYTEYLRQYFQKKFLPMVFYSPQDQIVLVTDHIPLKSIPTTITSDLIEQKISLTLEGLKNLNKKLCRQNNQTENKIREILIAGINPHAGEGGLLGNEDQNISLAIENLKQKYKDLSFKGPYPADTLYLEKKSTSHHQFQHQTLLVYMYHDQGLSVFKTLHQFIGINITLGLPFIRMSVDHGTAFQLFGKNQANYQGMSYLLKVALQLNN